MTWLLNASRAFGTTCANFPYGVENPQEQRLRKKQPKILEHLRLHGKYLIPGNGITTTSLIAVILRGILLNLLVWLPLAVALLVCLRIGMAYYPKPENGLGLLLCLAGIIGVRSRMRGRHERATLSRRTGAHCFWTRSAIWTRGCRASCCAL